MVNARSSFTAGLPKVPNLFNTLADVNAHIKNLQRELEKHNTNRFGKFSTVIGDGSTVDFNIKHNLSTYDVHVSVYATSSPYTEEKTHDIERVDANTITVKFSSAPSTDSRKVVVIG
jgi:hypothetical protein